MLFINSYLITLSFCGHWLIIFCHYFSCFCFPCGWMTIRCWKKKISDSNFLHSRLRALGIFFSFMATADTAESFIKEKKRTSMPLSLLCKEFESMDLYTWEINLHVCWNCCSVGKIILPFQIVRKVCVFPLRDTYVTRRLACIPM